MVETNCILHYGMPILSDEKLQQRYELFPNYDHYFYLTDYISSVNHGVVYVMTDDDKDRVRNKLNGNVMFIGEDTLYEQCKYYFPKSFEKINNLTILPEHHLYSIQQSLNEYVFYIIFGKTIHNYNQYSFMASTFYIEHRALPLFKKNLEQKNWYIKDSYGEKQGKGIWSVEYKYFKSIISNIQYKIELFYDTLTDLDHDSEKFRHVLFHGILKPLFPYGVIKKRLDIDKISNEKRIIGCKKWIDILYKH